MAVARAAGGMGSFLNSHWEPSRDFAYLKLPSAGVSSVVAVSSTTPQVLVATSEGFFYSYNIDLESGGECTLTRRELAGQRSRCTTDPHAPRILAARRRRLVQRRGVDDGLGLPHVNTILATEHQWSRGIVDAR